MALGTAAMWVAVFAGIATTGAGVRGSRTTARRAARLASLFSAVSVIRLAVAFLGEDWRFEYVADHTRSGVAALPRFAGVWAGPEGSLLLWAAFSAVAVDVALGRTPPSADDPGPDEWRFVAGFGGLLVACYLGVVALVASPFTMLALPAVDGLGLQPILEHPAMVWHPPLLYAGLVGLLVPSLLVAAAGWSGRSVDISVRTWAVPLGVLAAGLLSGSRWAHAELGWGGYWAWDPIESGGLAAWLAGVAALHLQRRPPPLPRRALVAVGVLPGLGAIWATTLTRIGVVSSVHAFADRPTLRFTLLAVAGLTSTMLLGAVGARVRTTDRSAPRSPLARDTPRTGGWILLVAALYVAAGTYQPLVEAATTGDRLAVAGTYFARILWPVALIGGAAAVRADRRWWPSTLGAVLGLVAVPFAAGPFGLALGAIGGAVAASALSLVRRRRPGALAHIGSGVLLIGVAGTLATTVTPVRLVNDEPREVAGNTFVHRSIEIDEGDVTSTATARVELDGTVLSPALVTYHLRGVSTAEVAHHSQGLDELQVVLLDADAHSARYRINRFPRIHLVWIGGLLVVIGLVGSQSRRRLRANNWSTVEPPVSSEFAEGGAATNGGVIG